MVYFDWVRRECSLGLEELQKYEEKLKSFEQPNFGIQDLFNYLKHILNSRAFENISSNYFRTKTINVKFIGIPKHHIS